MSSLLPFTKVQGLGNDFVVVDLRSRASGGDRGGSTAEDPEDPAVVRAICDRNFGVGGDGVLAVLPSAVGGDARMRVLNADGSEAEMCGNGIRCVAKFLYETDPGMRRSPLRIETGAGVLECAIDAKDGQVRTVAVEMGRPRLSRDEIPVSPGGSGRVVRSAIEVSGERFQFTGVSMGNPHAVIFVDDPGADLRRLAETFGPALERSPTFPHRTNVEFARIRAGGGQIDLVVWERGCGITLACGTGACATVVAACLEERLALPFDPRVVPGGEVTVNLPGGPLYITVAPDYAGVRMRGPATTVFASQLDLTALRARS